MSAVKGVSSRFGVVKGLITEQNDTNFEPDSMIAGENVVPEINGNLRRRPGLDIIPVSSSGEADLINTGLFNMPATDVRYGAMSRFKWENPNRNFNSDIAVIQVGGTVYFFKYAESLFDNFIEKIVISDETTKHAEIAGQPCSYAVVSGYLVIVNRYMPPLVVSCSDTGIISVERRLNLKMRVTDRMTSGAYGSPIGWSEVNIINRPTALNDDHQFDLRNAGWPAITKCTDNETGTSASEKSPIAFTFASIGVYPAIADVFLSYKTSSVEGPEALDTYSPWELEKSDYSTTTPPRGHFITNVNSFNMIDLLKNEDVNLNALGENTYNGNNLILTTYERPYQVGALNGHVIFVTKDYLGREILAYSKLVLSPADMEICYQEADPTADEINDIVPTDGGIIPLSHVPEIVNVTPGLGGLILFTVAGIYLLTGTQSEGFNATSQQINKISDVACLSGQGVTKLDDRYFFWNNDGLIALGKNQYGDIQVQNLTRGVIDLVVKQFSKENLRNALGDVDALTGRLTYVLPTSKGGDVKLNRYKSNIVLVLDTQLGGFYYHRIAYDEHCPYLVMPLVVSGNSSVVGSIPLVTSSGAYVTQTDGEVIRTEESILVNVSNRIIFLCAAEYEYHDEYVNLVSSGLTVAKEQPGVFRDWSTYRQSVYALEGLSYTSFAEFMHKRDANLSAGTNLTTIQSFFKVKNTTGIDFPGDEYSEEDPLILKYSCPIDEDSVTLETYPDNALSGVRFTALLTNKYGINDVLWYCKGTSFEEWGNPAAQYEYAPGHFMQALPTVEDTDVSGNPFPVEAINYLETTAYYTDTFALHYTGESTEKVGRMLTFTANFQSFGHGGAYPLIGQETERGIEDKPVALTHGGDDLSSYSLQYGGTFYWANLANPVVYTYDSYNNEYVPVGTLETGWYIISTGTVPMSGFYIELTSGSYYGLFSTSTGEALSGEPGARDPFYPTGELVPINEVQTVNIQLHQGGIGVNYLYNDQSYDTVSPLVMFQNLDYSSIAEYDAAGAYTSMVDFIKHGATGAVWSTPVYNDSELAAAIEGYVLRTLSRIRAIHANDNTVGRLAIDVGQGDVVQVGCLHDPNEAKLHVAARANGVTRYTEIPNVNYANPDSMGFRVHRSNEFTIESGLYVSSQWNGAFPLALATVDFNEFFGGIDNYTGRFNHVFPPANDGYYYIVDVNYIDGGNSNVIPDVMIRKVRVVNLAVTYHAVDNPGYYEYNWQLDEVAATRVRVIGTPVMLNNTLDNAVLLPSEAARENLTMTGVYGVALADDSRSIDRQLQLGGGAVCNAVFEAIDAISDVAVATSWNVKRVDCVRAVYCLNQETRGNFFVKPIDDFENAVNLSDAESKRAAIIGTASGDPSYYMAFPNTDAGRAGSSCSVGVTDSKVSMYIDLSVVKEAGYRVYSVGAAWFTGSCFGDSADRNTPWVRLDNDNIKSSDYGYADGYNLYVGSNCKWGTAYNPNESMSHSERYTNPLHYTSVSMPQDVLSKIDIEHTLDLGIGSY